MAGDILYFIETPLVRIAFILLFAGICTRSALFVLKIVQARMPASQPVGWKKPLQVFHLLISFFLPFHRAFLNRPVYSIIRYVFHICLFVAPVWYTSHVYLLGDSMLGWYWEPLPDRHVDMLTLVVLGIGLFFLGRRWFIEDVKQNSSVMDHVIIIITLLPFLTGYLLVNHTLDFIPFGNSLMWYLHLISGSLMMIMAVFLFVRTRLRSDRCVGCASCSIACPTGTLASLDQGKKRNFVYSHYQCICCGACVATCPEDAAALRHEIGFGHFFSIFGKKKLRTVTLNQCAGCNALYVPDAQMEKISKLLLSNGLQPETLSYCSRCRKLFSRNKSPKQ